MITHTVANSVDFGAPKRTVQFYKSSRPQAPARHYESPELSALVECSVCRGLFFTDDKATKAAHRQWHEQNKVMGFYYPMPCGLAVDAFQARYQFTRVCDECGEDLCPCSECQDWHAGECERWCDVNDLITEGKDDEADALADAILAER